MEEITFTGQFPTNVIAIKYYPGQPMTVAMQVFPEEEERAELYQRLAILADMEASFEVVLRPGEGIV